MQRTLLSFLMLGAFAAACSKPESDPTATDSTAPAPIVVSAQDIATAESRTIGAVVLVSGNLDPADIVVIKAQVPGTVTGVRVDRGSAVSRGDVLATIEAQGIRSQAAGAEAQVAAARAQLSVAQQRLEASKKLFEAGAISSIEYKTAQANVDAAEANVAGARANAAGASESAARATITAPISGVVSARNVSGGEAVNPGADLFTIVDASQLELRGQVGVTEASRVRTGNPVTFALDGYPNQVFRGTVARIDPTADPNTRQVGVYVTMVNQGRRIVGGQYARGRIETGGTTTATVVPEAAIVSRQNDSATVYVVIGNRVSRRSVTVGARDDATGLVAVHSGLEPGTRVLLNPSTDIGEGTLIASPSDRQPNPQPATRNPRP
jgi:membrane fusion protein (multidrug efflux system)